MTLAVLLKRRKCSLYIFSRPRRGSGKNCFNVYVKVPFTARNVGEPGERYCLSLWSLRYNVRLYQL